MFPIRFLLSLSLLRINIHAVPTPFSFGDIVGDVGDLLGGNDSGSGTTSTSSPTPVTNTTITSTLSRPALFSRVAYCPNVSTWSCGVPCQSLGENVEVIIAGGDGGSIPRYFVAHDKDTNTIVVAHEGTDPTNLLSLLNDLEVKLEDLDTTLFSSAAGRGIQVHSGFQQTFKRTASQILSTVLSSLQTTGSSNVLVTGHSLGAALATLDSALLAQNVPNGTKISTKVFALPRVGNQAWANYLDSLPLSLVHVTNQHDPVVSLPPRFASFQHPSGEMHITSPITAQSVQANGVVQGIVACPGQENSNCSDGNDLLDASVQNHLGPYFDGISFGQAQCPT